jgi:DNA-binding transcriptional ArsR family regulator
LLGESLRERFGERPEVAIKQDALKLLASDTRLAILKHLDQRRMTVSELARALDLNKSTVHEHLGKLVEGGLIKRDQSPEREWVYYELTKTARYVLQPASARFVLMMGVTLVAGLVMVAFLHVFLTAGQGLAVALDESVVPAGEANVWEVGVTRPGVLGMREPADQANLYLLSAEQAAEYQLTRQLPTDARALGAREELTRAGAGQFRFKAALDPGVHYLLATNGQGLPDALHPLRAEPVEVAPRTPSLLVGVDAPQVEVAVAFLGKPVDGGLVQAVDGDGRELAQVPVLQGKAVVPLQEAAEQVRFRFKPAEPGSAFAPAKGALAASAPHVAFSPSEVPLRVPTEVRVVVDDPAQGPRANASISLVRADGRAVAVAMTNETGAGSLTMRLTEPGEFILKAGDREVGRVTAKPGIRLWVEPGPHWEGEQFRVRTLHLGNEPQGLAGVAVLLDGREVGVTDDEGWLTLQFGLGGYYSLEAHRSGYVPGETIVEVLPRTGFVLPGAKARIGFGFSAASLPVGPTPPEAPRVVLDRERAEPGEPVVVRALLRNPDVLPRVLKATLTDNGAAVASKGVEVPPNGSAWVRFEHVPQGTGKHALAVNDLAPATFEVQGQAPAIRAASRVPGPESLALLAAAGAVALVLGRRR